MYVYLQSETGLFTVGFFDPQGKWHTDSDHNNRLDAANHVHWLNGGNRYVTHQEQEACRSQDELK